MSRSNTLRRTASVLAVLAMAGLTAGCHSEGPSAPVDYREGHYQDRPLPTGNTYTVQRGDTIYGIARQFNLSVRALIDANNLQPPYQLTVGQVLGFGTTNDYVVAKGDTLLAISRKIGVPFNTLARMNGMNPPYVVKLGQRLKLPAGNESPPVMASAPAPAPAAEPARITQAALPPPPPPPPLAAAPAAKRDGYATLADRERASAAEAAPPPPPPPPSSPPAQPTPASAPPPPAAAAAPAVVAEPKMASVTQPAPLPPAPAKGRGFIWPVKGEVIGEFGAAGRGVHNDGINIAVARGTPVHAADDGVVAYSGNELRGFGNLLLIKHADGWMTAYAHNDELLVKRGETVKRGQKIALAGDSGGVSQPQVHFEIRQGTHALDPTTVLKEKLSPGSSPAAPPDPG